jgi:hypothetical protein
MKHPLRHTLLRLCLLGLLFVHVSASGPSIDFSMGRYNNVCKDLKNDALLYFVFIDTRSTAPWSEFDILTTIDSINATVRWLEKEAAAEDVPLRIKTDYYIGDQYTTIQKNLPRKSLQEVVEDLGLNEGMGALSRWGDNISKIVGESLYVKQKEGIPSQKAPHNKERLIAYLRDEYRTESVALLFLLNNYYQADISLASNTLHNEDVEFAAVSYKYPAEIAHSILHLYGAADLSESPFRKNRRNLHLAHTEFPDDIMGNVYARSLEELEIGDFTKYVRYRGSRL